MAFQLVDDALDLSGDPSVTGKNAYADLREGKMTWPFLVGAERDPEIFAGLKALVSAQGEGFDEGAAQALVAGLQRVGALEETRRFAVECGEKARASLSALPAGEAREALEKVVEAAILRSR
jgi:octaprenyl-diphosphate synthase